MGASVCYDVASAQLTGQVLSKYLLSEEGIPSLPTPTRARRGRRGIPAALGESKEDVPLSKRTHLQGWLG